MHITTHKKLINENMITSCPRGMYCMSDGSFNLGYTGMVFFRDISV